MQQNNEQKRIYLDNAAATPVDARVLTAMEPYWREVCANAGALHREGVQAREAVEKARTEVAHVLFARPHEIVFTSGGTEGNNLAITGHVRACRAQGTAQKDIHIVTTTIEHSSVLDTVRAAEREGVRATYLPVDAEGFIDENILKSTLEEQVTLVSIIYAHNEIGTIQHIRRIVHAVRDARKKRGGEYPLLHIDASQAPAWMPCDVRSLGVDLVTIDGQKIYGPKGIGCLYLREGVTLEPILFGGGQEHGLRPGTPPTPLIVGFAHALTLVEKERDTYAPAVRELRDVFVHELVSRIPQAVVNGPSAGEDRLPNNANLSFPGLDAEQLVLMLDVRGVAASTRSACLLGDAPGSYVLRACGKSEELATSGVRFSLSRTTTPKDIADTIAIVCDVVQWMYTQH